jgi:hypothetical protein
VRVRAPAHGPCPTKYPAPKQSLGPLRSILRIGNAIQRHRRCKEDGGEERPEPAAPPCSPIGGAYANCTEEHVYHQRHPAVASAQEVRLTHLVGAAAPGRYRHLGGAEAPARALDARVSRCQQPRSRAGCRASGRVQEGGRAPSRKLPRSAGREYIVFTAAIRGNLNQTQARARRSQYILCAYPKRIPEQLASSTLALCSPHNGGSCEYTLRVDSLC